MMMMIAGFVDHKRRNHESCFDSSINSSTTSYGSVRAKKLRTDAEGSTSTKKERKDKIGERIAALQQLVSPFGKSDTASVLQEASGYIKFLHDQLKVLLLVSFVLLDPKKLKLLSNRLWHSQVLSAPYMRTTIDSKAEEAEYYSLRNRGLCLMPVDTTFGIAQSNGADLWTPVDSSRNP
ncbi:transcription factor bHLH153-like isoform X1 [Typha latifolia]|uniref:transcription factor bHLH153-like isoform X1 n=1 Tax=Typha latifolia TaxID=4733 RepID=UPI003C2D9BB7